VTRQGRIRDARTRLVYWFVVAVLAALAVGCLLLVGSNGWSALGILGLVGGLVCVAVLLSYAGSMRPRRTPGP
jgi:hypothetical protein